MRLALFLEKLRHIGAAKLIDRAGDQARELPGAMARFIDVPFQTGAARLAETLESFDIRIKRSGHS